MKKLLTNLIFILLSGSLLIAQTDFRKGYVVKLNGDTLHGYVNFRKEAANNSSCNFKRFEIGIPLNYEPQKLRAYGIDGGKQYLSSNQDEKFVFLEYLVKGKVSLLYLNRGGQHFYLLSENEKIVELKSGKVVDPNINLAYEHYKDFLLAKLKPGDYTTAIRNSKLEINPLVNLIKLYNEQSNYAFEIPQRPKEKSLIKDYSILRTKKVKFGILAGSSLYKFSPKTSENASFYMTNADFKWNLSPIGGVFLQWYVSRTYPNLSLQTNLMYQEVSLYGFSKAPKSSFKDIILFDDLFFDFNEMKIQGVVKYALGASKFQVVPHLGIGYGIRINSTYERHNKEFNTVTNIVKSYQFSDVKIPANEIVAVGGATFEYKLSSARLMFINFDYEYGGRLIDNKGNIYFEKIKLKGKGTCINITLGLNL